MTDQQINILKAAYYEAKGQAMLLEQGSTPYKSEFGEHPAKAAANLKKRLADEGVQV